MADTSHPGRAPDDGEQRWEGRPGLANAVRATVLFGPLVVSLLTTAAASRWIPAPADRGPRVLWWAALLLLASAAVWVSDRALRKLLPMAALLEMSVLFPGRAPSRFSVARKTGSTRQLQALVAEPGVDDEPIAAAARILALVGALRDHDRATRGHSERVRVLTDVIAEEMEISQGDRDRLRWAALLHDIGKLKVPPQVLNKNTRPTTVEWERLRAHPEVGAEIARPLLPWLGSWGSVIVQHHERWDGTGYPQGLSGDGICLGARIVSVADTFEVMTAGRPYQKAMPRAAAMRVIAGLSGTQLDPAAVRALLSISAPRLRGAAGPWGWLAQVPILGTAPSLGGAVGAVATTAATAAGALALGGALGMANLPLLPASSTTHPAVSSIPSKATSSPAGTLESQAPAGGALSGGSTGAAALAPGSGVGGSTPSTAVRPDAAVSTPGTGADPHSSSSSSIIGLPPGTSRGISIPVSAPATTPTSLGVPVASVPLPRQLPVPLPAPAPSPQTGLTAAPTPLVSAPTLPKPVVSAPTLPKPVVSAPRLPKPVVSAPTLPKPVVSSPIPLGSTPRALPTPTVSPPPVRLPRI